jgi:hypothetical protein
MTLAATEEQRNAVIRRFKTKVNNEIESYLRSINFDSNKIVTILEKFFKESNVMYGNPIAIYEFIFHAVEKTNNGLILSYILMYDKQCTDIDIAIRNVPAQVYIGMAQ